MHYHFTPRRSATDLADPMLLRRENRVDAILDANQLQCEAHRSINALQQLKALSRSLEEIFRSISDATSRVQSALQPIVLRHGLCSIPSEIFAEIFDLACEGSLNTNVQLICRRFREQALSTPSLWVNVNDSMPAFHIAQRLSRCADLGPTLSVVQEFPSPIHPCKCRRWSIFRRHAHKFVKLRITLMFSKDAPAPNVDIGHVCISRLKHIQWTSLAELILESRNRRPGIVNVPPSQMAMVISAASMPNLQKFVFNDSEQLYCVPWRSQPTYLHCNMLPRMLYAGHVVSFLGTPQAHSIERLELSLAGDFPILEHNSGIVATVPNLKHITIRPHDSRFTNVTRAIIHLLRYLHTPELEWLQVAMNSKALNANTLMEWLSQVRNRSLKKVEIEIFDWSSSDDEQDTLKYRIHECLCARDGVETEPDIEIRCFRPGAHVCSF